MSSCDNCKFTEWCKDKSDDILWCVQKSERNIAYRQGRVDAIDECVDILNDSFPLVDNMDIVFGFKCAVERLEQLKEQNSNKLDK